MYLAVSSTSFEGSKNPKIHLRQRQIKNLKAKEAELIERCRLLRADCEALELPLKKVTNLAFDNAKTPIASKLWKLNFNMQHDLMFGTYSQYKTSRKLYVKEAVENLDVLKYVNNPMANQKPISVFSKVGRNILKNKFLDMFRVKTPEEKQITTYYKRTKAMHQVLGI